MQFDTSIFFINDEFYFQNYRKKNSRMFVLNNLNVNLSYFIHCCCNENTIFYNIKNCIFNMNF